MESLVTAADPVIGEIDERTIVSDQVFGKVQKFVDENEPLRRKKKGENESIDSIIDAIDEWWNSSILMHIRGGEYDEYKAEEQRKAIIEVIKLYQQWYDRSQDEVAKECLEKLQEIARPVIDVDFMAGHSIIASASSHLLF